MFNLSNYRIRISIRRDRAILLSCMAIALVFWFFVKLSKEYRTNWTFALEYQLPEDKSFLERPPSTLVATMRGQGWDLMYHYLFSARETLVFDLEQVPPPGITRRLLFDKMTPNIASQNIEAVDISTDYIPILLEDSRTERVPVRLAYAFDLASEHHLRDSILLEPDSVTVTGAYSLLDELTSWPTGKGELKGIKEDVTLVLPLAPDPRTVLRIEPSEVRVTVPVEPFVQKTFLFLPVQVRNAPDSLRIFPANVTLSCVVGMSHYQEISAEDFEVEADLRGYVKNSENNTVPLVLTRKPSTVWGVRYTPLSAEFFFEVVDSLFWRPATRDKPSPEGGE